MKKKFSIIAMLLIFAILCFSFTACTGKSAYELARENGFAGTEREWLDSLKGSNGQDAAPIDIYALYDAYLIEHPGASFADFLHYFSIVDYYDTEYAAAKGIQSAVSIYSTFKKNASFGQTTSYSSAGSGVVYKIQSGSVYIITNYHVVYDRDSNKSNGIADTIEVYSYGYEKTGMVVQAQFIGGSITKDIAVIKASYASFNSNSSIKAVEIKDSNEIALGERVVAIGNPSAEGISVSAGVISVDSEEIEMEALDLASKNNTLRVMRTDAPINRGNSGGGLYSARGQLLGIVNAKIIDSEIDNIGFAIPINIAAGIADCVINNDSAKCILGISTTAYTLKTYYNPAKSRVEIVEAVTVENVSGGSLASGNLLKNDKIISVKINGGEEFFITRMFHLHDYLYKVRKNDTIHLKIERGGVEMTVSMTAVLSSFSAV